jgi:hypothetical protein
VNQRVFEEIRRLGDHAPLIHQFCCGLIEVDTGISVVCSPQEVSKHGRETQDLYNRV